MRKPRTQIWKAEARHDAFGGITGAPVLVGSRIIVPISSSGVGRGARSEIRMLRKATARWSRSTRPTVTGCGPRTRWRTRSTGKVSSTGVKQRGPSGAPIWSTPSGRHQARARPTPALAERNLAAGDQHQRRSLALDLATGELKWSFQALARDVWHLGCQFDPSKSGPNCPSPDDSVLKDYDFGAGVVIGKRRNGRDILVAGQKSGDLWGLDPDAQEQSAVAAHAFGMGTPLGGIHWGLCDRRRARLRADQRSVPARRRLRAAACR